MGAGAALVRSEKSAAHAAEQLAFDPDIELILDAITESSEQMLTHSHAGRALAEAATPEGALEFERVWRHVDAVMGPGKSAVQVLVARYASLRHATDRMARLLRRGKRARTEATLAVVTSQMDQELKAFAALKQDIVKAADQNVAAIKKQLQADMEDTAFQKLVTLSPRDVKDECKAALDDMERSFRDLRKALAKGGDASPGAKVLEERAAALITELEATAKAGAQSVIAHRVARVLDFGDPHTLGPAFAQKIKKALAGDLPALDELEDSAIVFLEALGAIGSARRDGASLLRRYVEEGAHTLNAKELKAINGYRSQLRGLLPEEVATRMKFLDSIFYKNAFETLADFPPGLRGQMKVEMVEGPLWVINGTGPARQFGDGSMLVTGPGGQSVIVGLGEFKAGFDENLLHQLFVRSDGRAVNSTVTFLGRNAKGEMEKQVRTLTREFAFDKGKKVAVTKPPVYVYGRPAGETAETAAQFKEMVEEQMKSGREMWKIQLPFTAESNERFAEAALREAVKTLRKANKRWGV